MGKTRLLSFHVLPCSSLAAFCSDLCVFKAATASAGRATDRADFLVFGRLDLMLLFSLLQSLIHSQLAAGEVDLAPPEGEKFAPAKPTRDGQ